MGVWYENEFRSMMKDGSIYEQEIPPFSLWTSKPMSEVGPLNDTVEIKKCITLFSFQSVSENTRMRIVVFTG